ncbi:MAG: hypothetical protein OEM38_04050 [Gammaproteobacteria bacterium]|nr:hypothetical protein [Gammaproteobacteria bacterium]
MKTNDISKEPLKIAAIAIAVIVMLSALSCTEKEPETKSVPSAVVECPHAGTPIDFEGCVMVVAEID